MLNPSQYYELLKRLGISFYVGVPDSTLKDLCACIDATAPSGRHIVAANEGTAAAIAAGYHMASGRIPLVYLQNSGLGNLINPMLSLIDRTVLEIPLLLLIGWRGEPGVPDEPQHLKQGESTLSLLQVLGVGVEIHSQTWQEAETQLKTVVERIARDHVPYALLIRRGTFASYREAGHRKSMGLQRRVVIEQVASVFQDAVFVSTTGTISRELHECRQQAGGRFGRDLYCVGSMGHASQVALGVAIENPCLPVVVLDGDGALIMHMGGMATIGWVHPLNLIHIVLNNKCHDSVGGQPTAAVAIDIVDIARACGYAHALRVETFQDLRKELQSISSRRGPALLEVAVKRGFRAGLGRPKTHPSENKKAFMTTLSEYHSQNR